MQKASNAEKTPGTGDLTGCKDGSLLLWVAGGFLLLAIGWTILFAVARSTKIESVPLATQPGKS